MSTNTVRPLEQERADQPEAAQSPEQAAEIRLSSRYMQRFGCIGSACEDTCCSDWVLEIDRASMARLKLALGPNSAEAAHIRPLDPQVAQNLGANAAVGYFELKPNGACAFLGEDGLCSLQCRHGESMLSDACAVFPRIATSYGDHVEIAGSLSCPEVARLCLLSEDGHELRGSDTEVMPRPYIGRTIENAPENPYAYYLYDVRKAVVALLRMKGKPLSTRLAFAAELGERTRDFFFAGTRAFDGADRPIAEERLAVTLEAFEDAGMLGTIERAFDELQAPNATTAALLTSILLDRRRLPHGKRFAKLLEDVFGSIQREIFGREPQASDEVLPDQLWAVYARRRAALDARLGEAVERALTNYATHYWMRWPYTDSPTLLLHACKLNTRVALLRFLVTCHPAIDAILGAGDEARAELEKLLVHVVQTFSKAIEHTPTFRRVIDAELTERGGSTLGRAACLAKFC